MATMIVDPELESRLLAERAATGADRYDEVWEGVYMMAPMPNVEHQDIVNGFAAVFQEVIRWPGLGMVMPGANVSDRVEGWERNYRVPDVAVFLRDGKARNCATHWCGGPDFVVEVLSQNDQTREKLEFYSSIKTREVLIVDRSPWQLELHRLEHGSLELVADNSLENKSPVISQVLPLHFSLAAADVRPTIEVCHVETNKDVASVACRLVPVVNPGCARHVFLLPLSLGVSAPRRFPLQVILGCMGLSIGYTFRAEVSPADARRIVRSLHQMSVTLDFDEVHDVREIDPPNGVGTSDLSEEQIRWVRVFGSRSHEQTWPNGDKTIEFIRPLHVVQFNARSAGAETATIGLASHPRKVQFERDGMSVEVDTQLGEAYSWCSSCKTQYAALPSRGGKPNFLRAHLALIALLDHAQELGLDVDVGDDGDYWNSRDQERLFAKLDEWNGLVAAITGRLKDAMPDLDGKFVAPITGHPDFEHMEARGADDLQRKSKDTDPP